jgi:hypothetical protein
MSRADTGVDVTDGATCIVQCKLRTGYRVPHVRRRRHLLRAPTATAAPCRSGRSSSSRSTLSRNLAGYLRTRRWDLPLPMPTFYEYVEGCLATAPIVLRDYQIEAIDLVSQVAIAVIFFK